MPQATTVPGWTGPGDVVAAVALAAGVAPLPEQAAAIASSPSMRVALAILLRASGFPIIWTPPVGTHTESSEDEDRADSIATPSGGEAKCPPGGARVAKRR